MALAVVGTLVVLAGPGSGVASAMSLPTNPGVQWKNFCGRDWKAVSHQDYIIANSDATDGYSCVRNADGQQGFTVTVDRNKGSDVGAYPDIYCGARWGTVTRGPLPMRISSDGSRKRGWPRTTLYTHDAGGTYNTSYDIWLTYHDVKSGDMAAEVMIWANHPNVWLVKPDGPIAWIENHEFRVMVWRAHNGKDSWNYIAFVAVHQGSYFRSLWLNPFFRWARSHGNLVHMNWYLQSVDAGFELWAGGVHNAVTYFSLWWGGGKKS